MARVTTGPTATPRAPAYQHANHVDPGAELVGRVDPGAERSGRDKTRAAYMLEEAACGLDTLIVLLDGFHNEVDLPDGGVFFLGQAISQRINDAKAILFPTEC